MFDSAAMPPDAEFGCCSIVYGPQDSDFEGEALLRVDLGDAKGARAKSLPLYLVLDAVDAIRCTWSWTACLDTSVCLPLAPGWCTSLGAPCLLMTWLPIKICCNWMLSSGIACSIVQQAHAIYKSSIRELACCPLKPLENPITLCYHIS